MNARGDASWVRKAMRGACARPELCETAEYHRHCACGEPIPGAGPRKCRFCIDEEDGLRASRHLTDREFFDALAASMKWRRSSGLAA